MHRSPLWIFLLALTIIVTGCGKNEEQKPPEKIINVTAAQVLARDLPVTESAVGSETWVSQAQTYDPTSGGISSKVRESVARLEETSQRLDQTQRQVAQQVRESYRCAPGRAKRRCVVPGSRASRGVESLWRFPAAGRPGPAKQNNAPCPSAREGLGSPVAFSEGRRTTIWP